MDWRLFEIEPGRTLEQAVLADPLDREAWAVLADFISGHAPRLGERIMLELDCDDCAAQDIQASDLRHRREWIDDGLARLFDRDGEPVTGVSLDWRYGFIIGLHLDGGADDTGLGLDTLLAAVLASPLSRFMARVSIDMGTRLERERERVRALIRASPPRPALTWLRYQDRHDPTRVDELLAWAPRLEHVHVHGHPRFDALDHEQLRELSLRGCAEMPGRGTQRPLMLPRLRALTLASEVVDDEEHLSFRPMLEGAQLPALEAMSVELPENGDFVPVILGPLGILKRLRTLEIPNCRFGSIGASALAKSKYRGDFPRLERLVVPGHILEPAELRHMRALAWDLVVDS